MSIASSLINKLMNLRKRFSTSSPQLLSEMKEVFGHECALCDHGVDYKTLMIVEGDHVPVCSNCKLKLIGGVNWQIILKDNYKKEKRRYSNKYLRIIIWSNDDD